VEFGGAKFILFFSSSAKKRKKKPTHIAHMAKATQANTSTKTLSKNAINLHTTIIENCFFVKKTKKTLQVLIV